MRVLSRSLLLATSLLAFGAQAAEGLWPTALHWNPDACTSFSAMGLPKMSEFAEGVEVGRCVTRHAGDEKARAACISDLGQGIGFFTDKCSSGWFLSLNGIEYSLRKQDPKSKKYFTEREWIEIDRSGAAKWPTGPELVGNFEGDGVRLRVFNTRLLKRNVDSTIAPPDDPVLDETFSVTVEIRKGGAKKVFPAILRAYYK